MLSVLHAPANVAIWGAKVSGDDAEPDGEDMTPLPDALQRLIDAHLARSLARSHPPTNEDDEITLSAPSGPRRLAAGCASLGDEPTGLASADNIAIQYSRQRKRGCARARTHA